MRQLFEEYNNTVSTASVEDFCRTVLAWLEQHCSLPALRPGNYQSSYLLNEYIEVTSWLVSADDFSSRVARGANERVSAANE